MNTYKQKGENSVAKSSASHAGTRVRIMVYRSLTWVTAMRGEEITSCKSYIALVSMTGWPIMIKK